MANPIVPMRPYSGSYDLKTEEMNCLNWYVLSGCPRDEAFLRFVRPDYLGNRNSPAVKEAVKQFFATGSVRDYIEAYRRTVSDGAKQKEVPTGSIEERKARAKAKAMEFAMSLADNIEQADDPETVLKLMDKVGLLDGNEEVEEAPRRYLPQSCSDHCAYRMFCEENAEDMCPYCKYHQFGEDNGVHYDKTEMLDVPLHSGTELASDTPQE